MKTLVIDYGMGNLFSLEHSLRVCGIDCESSNDPGALESADKIILPGVGSFREAMSNLEKYGFAEKLRAIGRTGTRPLFGICLGMQLLADVGIEGGEYPGLGLIPGKVAMLRPQSAGERVPHMGWNSIALQSQTRLFEHVPDQSDFYFCHSFHFMTADPGHVLGYADYCGQTVAAVNRDNVWGVQFHPEKSSKYGLQVLKNFCLA